MHVRYCKDAQLKTRLYILSKNSYLENKSCFSNSELIPCKIFKKLQKLTFWLLKASFMGRKNIKFKIFHGILLKLNSKDNGNFITFCISRGKFIKMHFYFWKKCRSLIFFLTLSPEPKCFNGLDKVSKFIKIFNFDDVSLRFLMHQNVCLKKIILHILLIKLNHYLYMYLVSLSRLSF
jgi:hypothetical protein